MRKYVIFLFALMALLGSLVTLWGTLDARNIQLRGYVDATQDADLPFRVPRLGVNVELSQYTPDELKIQLQRMETANITWLRQVFPWDAIEPQKGTYQWAKWDEIINTLNDHPDLHLVAVLMNTPPWARTELSPDHPTAPPRDPADFAEFAHSVASRYGNEIDYYQIWDEPNLDDGWGGLEPRPVDYVALLQAAYPAVHSADSGATVIAGGLAPTTETGPSNISDILYLRDMYAYGARLYMDAVAGKPHGFNSSPDDREIANSALNFSRIVALREEMVRNGDGAKALWASSWGWNSLPEDWKGEASIWGSVTPDEQISYTLAALDRAEREWPWLAGMTLQHWQPDAPPDDALWGFAVIDSENQPTRLWAALSDYTSPSYASNGLFSPRTRYAHYSGVWTFGALGADIGWLRDSQLDFDFIGRDVALLLRKDNYVAYLYSTVDNVPANALPQDADGNAYVILTSGSLQPELTLVPVAQKLTDAPHTLHVTADRGWDRWALAGFAVSSGSLAEPYDRQLVMAGLTAFIALVAAVITRRNPRFGAFQAPFARLWRQLNITGQIIASVLTSLALMVGMLLTWGDVTPYILRRDAPQLGLAVLTAGLIYFNPGVIITILALTLLFIIVHHRPDIGLMLIIFWAPFFLFPVELYRFAFPMVELMVLVTGAAWGVNLLSSWGRARQSTVSHLPSPRLRDLVRNFNSPDFGVIIWIGLGVISLLWASRMSPAVTELRVMMLEPALFYAVLRTTARNRKTILRLVDAALIAGFVVAIIGFITYLNPDLRITAEGGAQRLTSVYGSPNNVGLFLGRVIPFLVAMAVLKIDRQRRFMAGLFLVVIGFAVVLSQSVGALFIGIPAAVTAVALLVWRRKAWLPVLGIIILCAIAFLFALQLPRFARVVDLTQGTNFFRIRVWQSSIDLIQDHPITGVGLDQFLYEFRGHYIRPDAEAEPNLSHPHNIILDFWVRLGIVGVIVLIYQQAAFWRQIKTRYDRLLGCDPLLLAVTIGAMGSMVNVLAHGLVDNSVYVIDLSYVYMLLIGLASNLSNISAIDDTP